MCVQVVLVINLDSMRKELAGVGKKMRFLYHLYQVQEVFFLTERK